MRIKDCQGTKHKEMEGCHRQVSKWQLLSKQQKLIAMRDKLDFDANNDPVFSYEYPVEEEFGDLFCTSYSVPTPSQQ